jgi:hypothetical protein
MIVSDYGGCGRFTSEKPDAIFQCTLSDKSIKTVNNRIKIQNNPIADPIAGKISADRVDQTPGVPYL